MNLLRLNKSIQPVYSIDNFLSNEEIDKIIDYTIKINYELSEIGVNSQKKDKKPFTSEHHIKDLNVGDVPRIRSSLIKWIELNHDTEWLYKKLILQINRVNQENFDYILKFVENLQFTKYSESNQGFYSKHTDCGDCSKLENFVDVRKLSFSIQLSDPKDYVGGDLVLYKDNKVFNAPKTKGTIIFFQSNILHEIKPVKKGIRYSLVSWIQGPNLR
jgi:PKHD-type hydroxylase